MNLEPIFITPMFHDFLNLDINELEEYAYRLHGQSEGRQKSNRLGWQSNDIQYDEEVAPLIAAINERLQDVHQYIGLTADKQLIIDNMWVNINSKYSYNRSHIHAKSVFSGTYYVKVPDNSGNLNFKNPSQLQRLFINEIDHHITALNNFTAQNWIVQPHVDMMVLFPSWLEHDVDQNLSNDLRISIAFNTAIK
jgi:uncharacterized protein (TIGR02466 family)